MADLSYVPANATILYMHGWRNDSLYANTIPKWQLVYPTNWNNTVDASYFNYSTVYNDSTTAGATANTFINLTVLPNNLASITFNASDPFIDRTFALSAMLFDSNVFRLPITCIYPISGSYDLLSRVLFYILMVFSLALRRHEWISMTALGTAMTYGMFNSGGNLDIMIADFVM